ncbi:hypothetical protein DFH07DRAFT_766644 [Mycena maculata]|uniref:Uncharacterized protein n=1 Tax=Mycena maculata TaxID=230809 RepID=A0AAD7K2F9_9AGAR|nr:hypothetical protein DFH07DRAFT_766644 [Mycena maculata]
MAEVITLETNKCFHVLKWIGVANESGHSLALFTHAPISELVYLLTGSHLDLKDKDKGLYSMLSCDNGWEHWQALTTQVVYQILEVHGSDDCSDGEDDYEELDKGSGTKKHWLKLPRGAVKKASKNPKKPAKRSGSECRIGDSATTYPKLIDNTEITLDDTRARDGTR